MQVDQVRYFIDVARLGSMTAASRKHFMTPQGISRAISTLESELGVQLFERAGNKLKLTPEGMALLPHAEEVADAALRMEHRLKQVGSKHWRSRDRVLDFYCSALAFDTPFFYPALARNDGFALDIRMHQMVNGEIVEALLGLDEDDVASAAGVLSFFGPLDTNNAHLCECLADAGFSVITLLATDDYALVSSSSPLARKAKLSDDDVISCPIVVSNGDLAEVVEKRFGAGSVWARVADSSFRNRLAASGEAITFIPGLALAMGVEEGACAIPLENPWTVTVAFACRDELLEDGLVRTVLDQLTSYYRLHAKPSQVRVFA